MQHHKATTLLPLVNSPAWVVLEEHLREQIQMTHQELVAATSESEMFRLQGKVIALQTLARLKLDTNASIKDGKEEE